MGILNPGFTELGPHPGEAEHWTLRTETALRRIAGFGPITEQGVEGFERWFVHTTSFDDGALTLAFFDPLAEGHEDFEEAWQNDVYLTDLPGAMQYAAFGDGEVEGLDAGWGNDNYITTWNGVVALTALFSAAPDESFEAAWHANEGLIRFWELAPTITAIFDATTAEHFSGIWNPTTTI